MIRWLHRPGTQYKVLQPWIIRATIFHAAWNDPRENSDQNPV